MQLRRGVPIALLLCGLAFLALSSSADAGLRPGSSHPFLVGKHNHLALPLPRHPPTTPRLSLDHRGRAHLRLRLRYRVANQRSRPRVRADRALITPTISRRLLTTGPDPARTVYRKTFVDHRLDQRRLKRTYRFVLPDRAKRFLRRRGAFSRSSRRRHRARRLVWIDVQQDRDFKRVDGTYDWRQGTAFGLKDRPRARVIKAAKRAGEQNPYGTLSVTNNSAAGVYCQSFDQCPLVNSETGLPGTISGTMNSSTYAEPMAVAGDAVQCFDQGTNGSNPAGFANYNSSGQPQPYLPGTVSAADTSQGGTLLPNTSGTTVTEGLAADYSLAWAGNQQVAGTSGFISGTAKLGIQVIKGTAGGFVSPGAVITSVLGIFEYFLENSCKESGNYFNVSAAEPKGAAASATINAQTEEWNYYPGSGSSPPGLQLNPSALKAGGSHVWLNTDQALSTGLADNICDCSKYTGNNAIELSWDNYNPCIASPAVQCSLDPPGSPTVTNPGSTGAAAVNCGSGNVKCPFPAAHFPPVNGIVPLYATLSGGSTGVLWKCNPVDSYDCQSLDTFSNSGLQSMVIANGSLWLGVFNYSGIDSGYLYKCDLITANDCTLFDSFPSQGNPLALAYANGTVYVSVNEEAGTDQGYIFSCDANTSNSCTQFDNAGKKNVVASLAVANGSLYAGLSDGVLWKCSLTAANSCPTLDNAGDNTINSLSYGNGTLYAGISNGVLWSCNPTIGNDCQTLDTADNSISSVIYANGSVYAGVPYDDKNNTGGYIWVCSPTASNDCGQMNSGGGEITTLLYANNSIYAGYSDGGNINKCGLTTSSSCQQLAYGSESSQEITALASPPPPSH